MCLVNVSLKNTYLFFVYKHVCRIYLTKSHIMNRLVFQCSTSKPVCASSQNLIWHILYINVKPSFLLLAFNLNGSIDVMFFICNAQLTIGRLIYFESCTCICRPLLHFSTVILVVKTPLVTCNWVQLWRVTTSMSNIIPSSPQNWLNCAVWQPSCGSPLLTYQKLRMIAAQTMTNRRNGPWDRLSRRSIVTDESRIPHWLSVLQKKKAAVSACLYSTSASFPVSFISNLLLVAIILLHFGELLVWRWKYLQVLRMQMKRD